MDGMDAPKDGGGFAAAAPPVDGLGNYKGVMLCNRPVEESHPARMRVNADSGHPPFRVGGSGEREQLGLVPGKKLEARSGVKTRGPSAALRRHMQWIKELQVQVADENNRIVDDDQQQERRKANMQVLFKQQRDNIKDLKSKGLNNMDDVRKLETHLEMCSKPGGKGKTKSGKKPLWAMTEEEQEGADEEEAAALIDFAENLDFEKYLGDAEFRQQLQVMMGCAKKIQREQDKFKDDLIADFNTQTVGDDGDEFGSAYTGSEFDGGSQMGDMPGRTGPARRGGSQPDWDSSTAMGDDVAKVDRDARSDAGRVLDAMPALKGIHSKESVQKIIDKAREGTPQM